MIVSPHLRYRHWANRTLWISSLLLLLGVLLAYPLADHLSLWTQIAAHLLIPISAGFFKLGYVIRLASGSARALP